MKYSEKTKESKFVKHIRTIYVFSNKLRTFRTRFKKIESSLNFDIFEALFKANLDIYGRYDEIFQDTAKKLAGIV